MTGFLARLKPGAVRRKHLLLAALLWTIVGGLLLLRGLVALPSDNKIILFSAALIVGTLKSTFLLDRTVAKAVLRIQSFNDNTCLGAVYSLRTWGLVLSMMTLGVILRRSALAPVAIDFVSTAIGWALFWSSRKAWQAWRRPMWESQDK
ncbi:MAG: hypothetical protein H8E79_07660 [Desulfobulbaceae bacterium]|uniref:Uncharacterized protein n=1 Tax=Candidatus Desulfatifera sulfidica TaxID=2841691 RepID=A0A8J6N8U9_9BACT|nr:hypothetical protein [Candidatus Desulfatifera sulfidica]